MGSKQTCKLNQTPAVLPRLRDTRSNTSLAATSGFRVYIRILEKKMGITIWGSGFRVQGLGNRFRVQGLVSVLGFVVGFRV